MMLSASLGGLGRSRACSKVASSVAVLLGVFGVCVALLSRTVWWAGYDLSNCRGCKPSIDWSAERALKLGASQRRQYERDGVAVLRDMLPAPKIAALAAECDRLSNTFMTSLLARLVLPFYLRYEHRLDTRSALIRDWAVHGPLGKWAAELLGASTVRLYNAELIFHTGGDSPVPCKPAWHRDTVAAPFAPSVRAITFNVYLESIHSSGPHGDGLIYELGSHRNLGAPPRRSRIGKPSVSAGDLLAHDPNVYHTTSGEGCWRRRSLQFRYVTGETSRSTPVRFEFGPNRLPNGPVPWTLAHAPGIAPHGLSNGDELAGPWYPRVHPTPIPGEHVALPGGPWGLSSLLAIAAQSEALARSNSTGLPEPGFFGFDGPVERPAEWTFIKMPEAPIEMLYHKAGQGYKAAIRAAQ